MEKRTDQMRDDQWRDDHKRAGKKRDDHCRKDRRRDGHKRAEPVEVNIIIVLDHCGRPSKMHYPKHAMHPCVMTTGYPQGKMYGGFPQGKMYDGFPQSKMYGGFPMMGYEQV